MTKSSDASNIEAIDPLRAIQLMQKMDCPVNLLYEYQVNALTQFASTAQENEHLYALTEPGASDPSGIILYSVEKGRRKTTTLSCRLLLVSERTNTQVARALIYHGITEHTADRVEAQVIYHDPNADLWPWP